jgi:YidC/Oxa1 family membrane protein insertase
MIDNRNMILAVVLSIAILLAFDMLGTKRSQQPPQGDAQKAEQAKTAQPKPAVPSPDTKPQAPPAASPAAPSAPAIAAPSPADMVKARAALLKTGPRIRISAPRVHGSIALTGARVDDLTLVDYREGLDAKSPEIVLLIPKGAENAYFAEFGWVAGDGQPVPGDTTEWTADRDTLTPKTPVTLTWDNGQGLKFIRVYAIDANFMFTVTQKVVNTGTTAATLYPYGLISRRGTPKVAGFYILHEGPYGVSAGKLTEFTYSDLQEKGQVSQSGKGGWIGLTDKYWLAALVPNQQAEVQTRYVHRKDAKEDVYQVDFLSPMVKVEPGSTAEVTDRLFTGAKEVKLMDAYESALKIDRFDLAIDFGWFYFLTKPIFYALLYINEYVKNFGIAILLLTVFIKLAFFPLANKSYEAMSKMKKLQPEMMKIRERHQNDKMKMNEEMMALYKREKTNPASGCLPILIQIPVFFALYKVLFVNIEMRHAPFYGWIKDLSAADPTSLFNLFGLVPWTLPEFLHVGIWPILMGITMFVQQKLNPQPTDPVQAKIFLFLPIMFTFLLAQFPAGLVIYWTWNNILSMLQQWVIMRRMGIKPQEALK